MAVNFTNNWKNILDRLENILKTEFKGALLVHRGEAKNLGNQYLIMTPIGSNLIEYTSSSQLVEYDISLSYHFREPNMKKNALDHVFRQVSRIEALMHDNVSTVLSDSTNLFNIHLGSCDLDVGGGDSEYIVGWDLSCQHLANIG